MKTLTWLVTVLLVLISQHVGAQEAASKTGVGFATVDEALAFLKTKPGVSFTTTKPDGWLIANDANPFTIWSFTPQGHEAYPAVVKRELK